MIDFIETFDKFSALKKNLVTVEHDLSNERPLAAQQQAQYMRIIRMAENECQALLVQILRIKGTQSIIKRHGQDCPISWSAGYDPNTNNVTLATTDVFTNISESFIMPKDEFTRLVGYLQTIASQCIGSETHDSLTQVKED